MCKVTARLSRLLSILQVPPHSRASFCLAHFISFVSSPRSHWGNRLDLSCSPKPKWGRLWSRWCPLLNTMCFSFAHTPLKAESESLVGVGLRLTLWVAECYCPSALRSKPLCLQSIGWGMLKRRDSSGMGTALPVYIILALNWTTVFCMDLCKALEVSWNSQAFMRCNKASYKFLRCFIYVHKCK